MNNLNLIANVSDDVRIGQIPKEDFNLEYLLSKNSPLLMATDGNTPQKNLTNTKFKVRLLNAERYASSLDVSKDYASDIGYSFSTETNEEYAKLKSATLPKPFKQSLILSIISGLAILLLTGAFAYLAFVFTTDALIIASTIIATLTAGCTSLLVYHSFFRSPKDPEAFALKTLMTNKTVKKVVIIENFDRLELFSQHLLLAALSSTLKYNTLVTIVKTSQTGMSNYCDYFKIKNPYPRLKARLDDAVAGMDTLLTPMAREEITILARDIASIKTDVEMAKLILENAKYSGSQKDRDEAKAMELALTRQKLEAEANGQNIKNNGMPTNVNPTRNTKPSVSIQAPHPFERKQMLIKNNPPIIPGMESEELFDEENVENKPQDSQPVQTPTVNQAPRPNVSASGVPNQVAPQNDTMPPGGLKANDLFDEPENASIAPNVPLNSFTPVEFCDYLESKSLVNYPKAELFAHALNQINAPDINKDNLLYIVTPYIGQFDLTTLDLKLIHPECLKSYIEYYSEKQEMDKIMQLYMLAESKFDANSLHIFLPHIKTEIITATKTKVYNYIVRAYQTDNRFEAIIPLAGMLAFNDQQIAHAFLTIANNILTQNDMPNKINFMIDFTHLVKDMAVKIPENAMSMIKKFIEVGNTINDNTLKANISALETALNQKTSNSDQSA